MDTSKIWLSPPHMGGKEQQYINEAFLDNWIAPLGPNVNFFEQQLEAFMGQSRFVAALSSGTAALHMALVLLGVKAGDEVLCQSFTFTASANPIVYLGASPVFIDSESESWNMCPLALEAAILARLNAGKKPAAIIAVHLYGMPYKHDEISAIAEKYDIPVMEDSAEALGSIYKNKPCGTLGDIGILSFNGNKIITTSGGGAMVVKEQAVKQHAIFLATQARDNAPHYEHSQIGYNYRMSNICAGIGCGQMEVLPQRVIQKREIHSFYTALLDNLPGVEVFKEYATHSLSNFWLTTITIDTKKSSGRTAEGLRLAFEAENIEARPLWKPLHLQPVFKNALYFGEKVAETLFNTGLCLPSGTGMTDIHKERISSVILRYFN
ncbi:DegT/DnrJ/EryC1/StrS family aminotransferase [Flavobacterium psychrotrophum]|uniref:DegT/DnrJ/EryC1/StrS family aminotransferase n=1 Tax=Flavobacterium psychrotrophum TaxID=2294119 RepID=UPI000E321554|nr:DegT/DnrJ/EryC1/StrS family aminotransferase [Flavobacterium psychrotrophum]